MPDTRKKTYEAATDPAHWPELNQRYLSAELARVRTVLEAHASRAQDAPGDAPDEPPTRVDWPESLPPPALETLSAAFGLSSFERDVLLLCAGVAFDAKFVPLVAAAHGDEQRVHPTFGLVLAMLAEAHWSALTPAAPLRRWRLIRVGEGVLTRSPLHVEERVLHFLAGLSHIEEHLAGQTELVPVSAGLVPSHQELAGQIARTWAQREQGAALPVVQLCGSDAVARRAVAAAACAAAGLNLVAVRAEMLPAQPQDLNEFIRLWEREAVLGRSALLVEGDEPVGDERGSEQTAAHVLERVHGPVLVSRRERGRPLRQTTLTLEVARPTTKEQAAVWRTALGPAGAALNGQVDALVAQFSLGGRAIRNAATSAARSSQDAFEQSEAQSLGAALWEACRQQGRSQLDDLAQRIDPAATWADLVLPAPQAQLLHEAAAQVRQRMTVYHEWGFARKGSRGLGISALFAGPSGTGKTMAAEVLARDLKLDLYRVDLSAVVSKYIGETEKNLRRIFDAADEGGAILLFDEADALFGKRSEVKDGRDRYANVEVSYLLQRMEAYRGLAVLTTNLEHALDTAFLRRIRFVIQFPFPSTEERAEIWRRIFPRETPTDGLDAGKLARLSVTGGHIRTIALNAAFLAADAGSPVRMAHLLRAARSEYGKLKKALTEAEVADWI